MRGTTSICGQPFAVSSRTRGRRPTETTRPLAGPPSASPPPRAHAAAARAAPSPGSGLEGQHARYGLKRTVGGAAYPHRRRCSGRHSRPGSCPAGRSYTRMEALSGEGAASWRRDGMEGGESRTRGRTTWRSRGRRCWLLRWTLTATSLRGER